MSWRDQAACKGKPTSMFFPDGRNQKEQERLNEEAKAVCRTCPVIVECYQAGRTERFGVWGGMTVGGRIKHQVSLRRAKAS